MSTTGEALSFAMARRTLMQRYQGPDDSGADEVAAQQLHASVHELAQDGTTTQVSDVTRALIAQQILTADDVRALWPNAPQMQIAAAQMTVKARLLPVRDALVEETAQRDRSRREVG